jgi:hypothetical protein
MAQLYLLKSWSAHSEHNGLLVPLVSDYRYSTYNVSLLSAYRRQKTTDWKQIFILHDGRIGLQLKSACQRGDSETSISPVIPVSFVVQVAPPPEKLGTCPKILSALDAPLQRRLGYTSIFLTAARQESTICVQIVLIRESAFRNSTN